MNILQFNSSTTSETVILTTRPTTTPPTTKAMKTSQNILSEIKTEKISTSKPVI